MTVIFGDIVELRPAREDDRRAVYDWLVHSDASSAMLGPPKYPEVPKPTWAEFCADYGPEFFDGSLPDSRASYIIEKAGEAVGHLNYELVDAATASEPTTEPASYAELDIWLRSERDTGRGYGSDALSAMMNHLHSAYGISTFVIRPSARNPRAVRAYQKAGFTIVSMSPQDQAERYGPGDYDDTVVLVREYPIGR